MTDLYQRFEKRALARWQVEERSGNLSPSDRSRIGYGIASPGENPDHQRAKLPTWLVTRETRRSMQSYAPELGPVTSTTHVLQPGSPLARHQRLNALQVDQFAKHGPLVNRNLPVAGPANLAGMIFMGEDGPDVIHSDLNSPARLRDPASNGPIRKAIVDHERAEGVQLWAQMTGKTPSSSQASHAGLLPILAERMATKDPAAQELLENLRLRGGEDAKVNKMLRNAGGFGNYVPPMGGRVHRRVEEKIRRLITPNAAPMRVQRALLPNGATDAATYLREMSSLPQEGLWQRLSRRTHGVLNPRRMWGGAAAAATLLPMLLHGYGRYSAKNEALSHPNPEGEPEKTASALPLAFNLGFHAATPVTTLVNEAARRRAVQEGNADPDNPYAKANLYGTLGTAVAASALTYAATGFNRHNMMPAYVSNLASTLVNSHFGSRADGHDVGWRQNRFRDQVRQAVDHPEEYKPAPAPSMLATMSASDVPWMHEVLGRIAKRQGAATRDYYNLKTRLSPEDFEKVKTVLR